MFKNLNIRTKIFTGFLVITLLALAIGFFAIYNLKQIATPLKQDLPKSIETLSKESKLDNLSQAILYYDEVLTQSARNYAFTQDIKWKDRYNSESPKLDAIIKEAINLGSKEDKDLFSSIDSANIALVEMEMKSMGLVDNKDPAGAIEILESPNYSDKKAIYKSGIDKYISRRGSSYEQAMSSSVTSLKNANSNAENILNTTTSSVIIAIVLIFLIAIFLSLFISRIISKPIKDLQEVALEISQGKEDKRVIINSKDEIGKLGEVFNQMAENIKNSKRGIENKVKERTAELGELNSFMVDRELKMVELKKKIDELENKKQIELK
jgi:nitrogen fixation/metabolism regulation signal transduction histidine kinase